MKTIVQSRGAALKPLSSAQRQKLAGIAAQAHKAVDPRSDFGEWRHEQVEKITGRGGLRECRNEHYLPLLAHFQDLLGNSDAAFRAAFKGVTEPRSWALHTLQKEANAMKDVLPNAMAYARGFLKNKRGVTLEEASDKDIWHAVFTIRRKAQSLRKKTGGGESMADVLTQMLKPSKKKASFEADEDPF